MSPLKPSIVFLNRIKPPSDGNLQLFFRFSPEKAECFDLIGFHPAGPLRSFPSGAHLASGGRDPKGKMIFQFPGLQFIMIPTSWNLCIFHSGE